MKKIAYIMLASAGLLFTSCSPKVNNSGNLKNTNTSTPLPPGKLPVPTVTSMFVLHPVEKFFKVDSKTYHSFYDYLNQFLPMSDNEDIYKNISDFLPDTITKDRLGYAVTLQSASAYPLANFTPEVLKEIASVEGLEFQKINDYYFGKAFNIKADSNSVKAMQILLDMLQPGVKQYYSPDTSSSSNGKILVGGIQGMLTLHPIKNPIKATDGKIYYLILDNINHWIYITDIEKLYLRISDKLPFRKSKTENAALTQVVGIDPFVRFDKKTLDDMTKDLGLKINGDGKDTTNNMNNTINGYHVGEIVSCSIVIDRPAVIIELNRRLHPVENTSTASTTNRTQSATIPKTQQKTPDVSIKPVIHNKEKKAKSNQNEPKRRTY